MIAVYARRQAGCLDAAPSEKNVAFLQAVPTKFACLLDTHVRKMHVCSDSATSDSLRRYYRHASASIDILMFVEL